MRYNSVKQMPRITRNILEDIPNTTASVYKCFFDGACEPANPGGNMGIGGVIYKDGQIIETHTAYVAAAPCNSNNVAEYKGFLWVLDCLEILLQDQEPGAKVEISGDSMLVIKQMNGLYKIKEGFYVPFATEAKAKLSKLKERAAIAVKWIPGHTNHEADQLSRQDVKESAFTARTEAKKKAYSKKRPKAVKI